MKEAVGLCPGCCGLRLKGFKLLGATALTGKPHSGTMVLDRGTLEQFR